jgi:ABC-2 type transport system ATP-binding protein
MPMIGASSPLQSQSAPTSADVALSFDGVDFAYTRKASVLHDVSLTVRREEVVALLGRNGEGKSTLMYLALGLLRPGQGTVRTMGHDPVRHAVAVKQRIGFVSEQPMFPPHASGREILALHRALYPTWDAALERELVERFGLGPSLGKSSDASKGQRQQLALLCAVCHRPELLLLDEPAAGLDPTARREFMEMALRLLSREGTAILFSSHHMGDVERLGGRAALLHGGRIALDAPLDVLREAHTLVVMPQSLCTEREWRAAPHVRRVRLRDGQWRAIVAGTPLEAQRSVQRMVQSDVVQYASMTLEEFFVEFTARADDGARTVQMA